MNSFDFIRKNSKILTNSCLIASNEAIDKQISDIFIQIYHFLIDNDVFLNNIFVAKHFLLDKLNTGYLNEKDMKKMCTEFINKIVFDPNLTGEIQIWKETLNKFLDRLDNSIYAYYKNEESINFQKNKVEALENKKEVYYKELLESNFEAKIDNIGNIKEDLKNLLIKKEQLIEKKKNLKGKNNESDLETIAINKNQMEEKLMFLLNDLEYKNKQLNLYNNSRSLELKNPFCNKKKVEEFNGIIKGTIDQISFIEEQIKVQQKELEKCKLLKTQNESNTSSFSFKNPFEEELNEINSKPLEDNEIYQEIEEELAKLEIKIKGLENNLQTKSKQNEGQKASKNASALASSSEILRKKIKEEQEIIADLVAKREKILSENCFSTIDQFETFVGELKKIFPALNKFFEHEINVIKFFVEYKLRIDELLIMEIDISLKYKKIQQILQELK